MQTFPDRCFLLLSVTTPQPPMELLGAQRCRCLIHVRMSPYMGTRVKLPSKSVSLPIFGFLNTLLSWREFLKICSKSTKKLELIFQKNLYHSKSSITVPFLTTLPALLYPPFGTVTIFIENILFQKEGRDQAKNKEAIDANQLVCFFMLYLMFMLPFFPVQTRSTSHSTE